MGTALASQAQAGNGTDVAKKSVTIKELICGDAFKQAVSSALPSHLKPERFIRIALTALTRTPKLQQCDQSSFFNALLTLSQLGLEPDGRRAHLIPFENRKRGVVECTLICDYKGLVELAMRSGKISNIHADVVCDNDEFEYNLGEITKHKVNFRQPRGNVYAAYAFVRFRDGTTKCEVLGRDEIESVRKRSRAANNGPWVTDWNEMSKKTAFRRLSKWIELSPEIADAIEADDNQFEHKHVVDMPATVTIDHLASLPQIGTDQESFDQTPQVEAEDIPQVEHEDTLESHAEEKVTPPKQEATNPAPVKPSVRNGGEKYGKDSPAWTRFEELRVKFGQNQALLSKESAGWTNTPFDKLSTKQLQTIIERLEFLES